MRKESIVTIEDNGNLLKFRVRQMPATKLHDFIGRAFLVMADCGLELSDVSDAVTAGENLLQNGLRTLRGIDYAKAKPLLDELTACCTRISESGVEQTCTPDVMDGFIDDVRTIFKLQWEAAKMNFNFFADAPASIAPFSGAVSLGGPQIEKR